MNRITHMNSILLAILGVLAGLVTSFDCVAGPQLVSVLADQVDSLLVTVNWGKMMSDPQRDEFTLPCPRGNCKDQDIGLIAKINGREQIVPILMSRLDTAVVTEADALRLLILTNRQSSVWRFRIHVPIVSDLCFKYTLGYKLDVHDFHGSACIGRGLLTPGEIQASFPYQI